MEKQPRLGTIRFEGGTRAALVLDDHVDVMCQNDVGEYLSEAVESRPHEAVLARIGLEDVEWAPLIVSRRKIFCLGHNYLSHIQEMNRPTPEYPAVFAKFQEALIGANDDILLPSFVDTGDWEAELAVIIGRTARNVDTASAHEYISGFSVINDISVRSYQARTTQYLQGKTFEHSSPLGPVLVPGEQCDWARDLKVQCLIDGELVQNARTSDHLFKPEEVVSYLSAILTLDPGDVIAMGTSSGVGVGRSPQRFLLDNEVVKTEIEGIGVLRNRVRIGDSTLDRSIAGDPLG